MLLAILFLLALDGQRLCAQTGAGKDTSALLQSFYPTAESRVARWQRLITWAAPAGPRPTSVIAGLARRASYRRQRDPGEPAPGRLAPTRGDSPAVCLQPSTEPAALPSFVTGREAMLTDWRGTLDR